MSKAPSDSGPMRIWIVSELYYPEETSTGYLLTKIAEGLAAKFSVAAVCGKPITRNEGCNPPPSETRRGVQIYRCRRADFGRRHLFLRLIDALVVTVSMSLGLFARLRAGDCVLVVTNPPLLPFAARLVCILKRAKFVLIIHDVYPEVFVAAGLASSSSLVVRAMSFITRQLYRSCDAIITLGRDMKALVDAKKEATNVPSYIIPNWSDVDLVQPEHKASNPLLHQKALTEKFVVQYAGNMGLTHDLESVVAAAEVLKKTAPRIHFLLVGSGAKRKWLEQQCSERGLTNTTLVSSQPRASQNVFLNACDLAVIAFVKGMSGVSVPSRLYNIMASGKPIIAMADPASELALVVKEEKIGWVIDTENPQGLVQALIEAASSGQLAEMGYRARAAAQSKYRFEHSRAAYEQCLQDLP